MNTVNKFKIGLIRDFGGDIVSPYYGPGWGFAYVYFGLILGGLPAMTLGVNHIENTQTSNTLICSIAIAIAVSLLEYIIVKIDWVDVICDLIDSEISKIRDKYGLQKSLLVFIGIIIEVLLIWGSLDVIEHFVDIDFGLVMFYAGLISMILKLICGFVLVG